MNLPTQNPTSGPTPHFQMDGQGTLFLGFGSGEELREVELAAFSGDGKRVLTVQEVGIARVWEVASGKLVQEIVPGSPMLGRKLENVDFKVFIESAALNHDGSLALLGLNDESAGLFRVEDCERLAWLHDPDVRAGTELGMIRAVNFSQDGQFALVGFYDLSVGVWRVEGELPPVMFRSPKGQKLISGYRSRVSEVTMSADNHYVFVGCSNYGAAVWERENRDLVFEAVEHEASIKRFWSDESRIRWASGSGTVWESFWDSREPATRFMEAGENWVNVAFSQDGSRLLTRSSQGTVSLYSMDGQREILAETVSGSWSKGVRALGFSGTCETCFYCETTTRIAVHGPQPKTLEVDEKGARTFPSDDGRRIATFGRSGRATIWSVPSGEALATLEYGKGFEALGFSNDGSLIAIAGVDQEAEEGAWRPQVITIFRVDGQFVRRFYCSGPMIKRLLFSQDNARLVSASSASVRMWDLTSPSGDECWGLKSPKWGFQDIGLFSDGRILVVGKDAIEVWRAPGEKLLTLAVPEGLRRTWHVTPDERYIVLETHEQRVLAWRLEDGAEIRIGGADTPRPEHVPNEELDSQFETTAGGLLWRVPGGPYVHIPKVFRAMYSELRLSDDGRFVLLPGLSEMVVVSLDEGQKIVSRFQAEGAMRASRILDDRVLTINQFGRVYEVPFDPAAGAG